MANRYDEDSDSAHQKAVRSSQFGDGPGSGRNRLARRLRIGLSNSCQEAIARSKSQPFQVSMQGQLVMLGFISSWVKTGALEGGCSSICATRGKRRRSSSGKDLRGFIPNRVRISQRPQGANLPRRVGDWEGDPVVSRISKAGLLVLVERRSRLIKLERLSNRPATTGAQAICSLLKGHKVRVRVRSITADHGTEFAAHGARSRKINAPFLFADPYSSWQRGRVENAIGLGRGFIPQRTDLRNYSHRRIRQIENNLNSQPMKLHDWLSRSDVYSSYRCCAK